MAGEDAIGLGFWIFLSIYLILNFMAFWLITDRETRKECLSWLRRGFLIVISLWLVALIGLGILLAIIAAAI